MNQDSDGIQLVGHTEGNITPIPHENSDKLSFDAVPLLSLHRTNKYVGHSFTPLHACGSLAPDNSTPIGVFNDL